MTEENQPTPEPRPQTRARSQAQSQSQAQPQNQGQSFSEMAAHMRQALEQLFQTARVNASFGEARTVDNRTIIPVSKVSAVGGFGLGMGEGTGPQTEGNAPMVGGSGGGGGSGGSASSTPMAVIVVTPDDVTIKPIFDLTQVGMAALAALSFNAFWVIRMMRNTSKAESAGANFTPGMMRKWLKF